MSVRREPWGTTREGEPVELLTLEQARLRARLTSFGATLVALEVPDRRGERADVVLGFDALADYDSPRNPYFGGIVGRCANRIAGARFTLDGREHVLSANEGRNHLHGGVRGFDRRPWAVASTFPNAVWFRLRSADGEEGYPGLLDASASYTLGPTSSDRPLSIGVIVEARSDAPTLANMTQHSYFNLAGEGTILEHELQVFASRHVAVDEELLPTGELASVAGTPFDFREPRRIGERIDELARTPAGGYDLCYALDEPAPLRRAARLRDPRSGRTLEILTDAPGLQLYTANRLAGVSGKGGRRHERFGGLCLETQRFPDAVHHPAFPSVVLRPREQYRSTTVWTFSAG